VIDGIFKGVTYGDVADRLLAADMDPNALRPYMDKKGRSCVALFNGYSADGKPQWKIMLTNAPALLMKEVWIDFDAAVVRAARPAMRVWSDLTGAGLTYNVPNGMGVTVIQHQTMSDAGEATLSMDALRQSNRDRPTFDLANLPLPIVHSDFSFSLREILVSRRQRVPLDTTMIEQETHKCVEQIEKLTLGTTSSYTYGGGTVYGLSNFPARYTKVITDPSGPGWTPETTYNELLDMIQTLTNGFFGGPYGVWYSPGWTKFINQDYSAAYPNSSLMQKFRAIGDVRFWNKADYLPNYTILVVQLSPWVIQAVTGMRLQTLQWDSHGGLQKNFKIMGIMVPRIRANQQGNTGIMHGATSSVSYLTGTAP
jgi:uncharacterized linocin/CFP29 family protein